MAAEGEKTTRAFIALDLPDALRSGIEYWGRTALSDPGLRAVPPASLHVTLAFLGDLSAAELERAASIVCETEPAAVGLVFSGAAPIGLPRRRRKKRVYAVSCDSPAAVGMQADLEARLLAAGVFEPERPFWPHVTVARVRSGRGSEGRGRALQGPSDELPGDLLHPFDAVRLTLYLSKTKSAGAEYAPLAQVELPRGTPDGQQ